MEKVGKIDAPGKGYIWRLGPNGEPKKENWSGDYTNIILDAIGYVIVRINSEDKVPVVTERETSSLPFKCGGLNSIGETELLSIAQALAVRTKRPI